MVQVIPPSTLGRTAYERVMGHAPHVLGPWTQLEQVFASQTLLPADLLEQVRRVLAQGHGCAYCQAKGGAVDPLFAANALVAEDRRATLVLELARQFAQDHRRIEPALLSQLREHDCSAAELVELIACMSFMWAGGMFGRVLGIQPPGELSALACALPAEAAAGSRAGL
ncbi:carboxymuconolactone decarboxylase family protein [Paucibacter sp. KBW04]|uniref:carboxymuconolactone decarboxylase family protein n=1 Tax=Paucibacter sp. KBW04 TaxID=2153361 RepID=UPI000F5618FE|nr:hypothetical protein [Paucibacter sp. KBW04]